MKRINPINEERGNQLKSYKDSINQMSKYKNPNVPDPKKQQQPLRDQNLRASGIKIGGFKWDPVKDIKNLGRDIDDKVLQPIGQAVGLTDKPIPEEYRPKINQDASQAYERLGQDLTTQGQKFDPTKFGQDYFQPQEFNPQITSTSRNMPGIWSPQRNAPTAPGVVNAPDMQTESNRGNVHLHSMTTGIGANLYGEQGAVRGEMQRMSQPMNMQAGFDPNLRQTYIDMATSGLEKQKEAAMAQLKEQQLKSGNFGSSVGQKQMMELQQDYDRQAANAAREADLMQMEAEREDRYRNVGVDMSRAGLVGNLAGQGANMELAREGFDRDTLQLDNQARMIKENFARQGRQIDNATAMQMAQFNAGQQQQGFQNKMQTYGADINNQMASYGSEMDRYGMQREDARYSDSMTNQADMFNIGQRQDTQTRNYGMFQDYLNNMARYGGNQIDPQSQINYELYQQQQADKNRRFGSFVDTVGKIAQYAGG